MTEFLPILERFGLPVALLAVMVAFLWKAVWPFLVRRVEAGDQQVARFTETLQKNQELMDKLQGQLMQEVKLGFAHMDGHLHKISDDLDTLLKDK